MIRPLIVSLLLCLPMTTAPASAWTPEELQALRADAESGDARAQYLLGRALATSDPAEAVRWYRKAADQGQREAQASLGFAYLQGEGVAKDETQAAFWYRKAAEQGEQLAQWTLGGLYQTGRGVPANLDEALKWYEAVIATDAADGESGRHPMTEMAKPQIADIYSRKAILYDMGFGVPKDPALGYFWLSRSAQLDPEVYADSLVSRSRELTAAERAAAERHIREWATAPGHGGVESFAPAIAALHAVGKTLEAARAEAERGDAKAKARLAARLDEGDDLPLDRVEASAWYRRAAETGDVESMFQTAQRSRYGRGMADDDAAALAWYRKAAEAGHVESLYRVGEVYQMGIGVPVDDAESVRWYRKAAERDHPLGVYALGEHIARGVGTPKDEAEGARWIQRAAEMWIKTAQWEIGDIYAAGRGVAKDPVEALFWLGLAARSGEEEEGQREKVAAGLSPKQLAEIEARIDAWIAAHPKPEDD